MRYLNVLAVFLMSTFAVGQTVSVGAPSSTQAGNTTTITVPVVVNSSAGATTVAATPLPLLSVSTPTGSSQVVGSTFTTIAMSSVIADTAGAWNASTNSYTAPNTGTYLIVSKVRLADGSPANIGFGQGVNTTNIDGTFFMWTTTAGLRNSLLNMRLVNLTGGQKVNLYTYVDVTSIVTAASLTIQELN